MSYFKIIFILILSQYIFGCSEKTTFSGKIITQKDLDIKILNKKQLQETFGLPSYVDNFSNKHFYFTEKSKEKNFYNKKIEYSYLFVFEMNENDEIINIESIDLLNNKNHKYKKTQTESEIINRGLLEKVFGGIGPSKLPNSP